MGKTFDNCHFVFKRTELAQINGKSKLKFVEGPIYKSKITPKYALLKSL